MQRLVTYFRHAPEKGEVQALDSATFSETLTRFRHAQAVLVAGGDGTISSALAAYVGTDVRFGIWPLGTGNDLARECGTRMLFHIDDVAGALNLFAKLPTAPLSLWTLKAQSYERIFSNYCSFGFDAEVVRSFDQMRRARIERGRHSVLYNRALFARASLRNLKVGIPNVRVSLNAEGPISPQEFSDLRGLLIANIQSIMGLGRSNLLSNPFDKKIELVPIKTIFTYMGALVPRFSPWRAQAQSAEQIRIECDTPLRVQVDGEAVHEPLVGPIDISIKGTVPITRS